MDSKINTILFDLDGTLLPMDDRAFMESYFRHLCEKCCPMGYAQEEFMYAVRIATVAMQENDGRKTLQQRFWQAFSGVLGKEVLRLEARLERFYAEEFHRVREVTAPNPAAAKILARLKDRGYKLVLATKPMFPKGAALTRLSWLGIDPGIFSHITSYENCRICKPEPGYYEEILQAVGSAGENCLMVGNDMAEDSRAMALGMDFYLVTDNLINRENMDTAGLRQGSFEEFCLWIDEEMQ